MTTASEETIERLKERAAEEEAKLPLAGETSSEKPKKESTREYVVFQQGQDKATWVEVVRAVAASAEAAVASLGGQLKDNATYAAIPSRSFHTVTVAIETTTTVKLK